MKRQIEITDATDAYVEKLEQEYRMWCEKYRKLYDIQ